MLLKLSTINDSHNNLEIKKLYFYYIKNIPKLVVLKLELT